MIIRNPASLLPAAALVIGLIGVAPDFTAGHAHADMNTGHAMSVMKTPTCGCCGAWVDLARREGFEVEVTDMEHYAAMKELGSVPEPMWSCHTTRIGGYTVEGHVPFAAVRKLMTEKPDITGIAVPGMPDGSPGMGDDPNARFDVLAFGGEAKPDEVFFKAGLNERQPGWLDKLLGR